MGIGRGTGEGGGRKGRDCVTMRKKWVEWGKRSR